jgi:glycosyltransferase EpsF
MKTINNKIKVLQVSSTMNLGGRETMIMNFYRNMTKNQFKYDFLYYTDEECFYDKEILESGGKIIRIHSPSKTGFIRFFLELIKALRQNGPYEVIHAHNLFNIGLVMLAARIAGIKIRISHSHSSSDDKNGIFHQKIYIPLMRYLIKNNSTVFLACGKLAGEFLYGKKFSEKKAEIIKNGININIFNNDKQNETYKISFLRDIGIIVDNVKIICHIGRFERVKNHKFIIEIAKHFKVFDNYIFLLVGDGSLFNDINDEILRYGLENQVKLLGLRKDTADIYKITDAFILPSLHEALPVTLVEAQASGVPCIVSDNVPKEADFNLGLMKFLPLGDASKWGNEIILSASQPQIDKDVILDTIRKSGYDIIHSTRILENIYTGKIIQEVF